MNITISDRLLSLPLMSKPDRLAVLVRLLLSADEAGIVRQTSEEVVSSSGVLAPTLQRTVREFEDSGLVATDGGVIRFMPTSYWNLSGRRRKPVAKSAPSSSALPVDERIRQFAERFAVELGRWRQRHTEPFPEQEQQRFLEYWTARNAGDRKFLAEKGTFMWQNRINTWVSRYLKSAPQPVRTGYDIEALPSQPAPAAGGRAGYIVYLRRSIEQATGPQRIALQRRLDEFMRM